MNKIVSILLLCSMSIVPVLAQTLESLQAAAISNNRTLKNARLDISSAKEDKKSAFTNYFPRIDAMGMSFKAFNPLVNTEVTIPIPMPIPGMGSMPISALNKGALGMINAVQPVFLGGQVYNGNKLAAIGQQVSMLKYKQSETEVLQQVAELYWQVVALKANVLTIATAQKQLEEVHAMTQNFVSAGLTTRNDLLRVEVEQQKLLSQKLTLDNGIRTAEMFLAQLCGLQAVELTIPEQMDATTLPAPQQIFVQATEAVKARTELALADKGVEAAKYKKRMEVGKLLPSFAVGVNGFMHNLMQKTESNGMVFGVVSVPITSWWSGSHAIRKAEMAKEQALNTRQDAEEKLQIDIQASWNALQEAYAQIAVARKSQEASEENLRMCMEQYKAGTLSLVDFLEAQTLNVQSNGSLTGSVATYNSRMATYLSKIK